MKKATEYRAEQGNEMHLFTDTTMKPPNALLIAD